MGRVYKQDTHEPHPSGMPLTTCETYPREDDYADIQGGIPTDPLDLEMRGKAGFQHVRCPRGKTRCQCGLLSYHLDSLVIAVDGTCPGNGGSSAARSSGGIWFRDGMGTNSPRSDYRQNFAFSIPDHPDHSHTSQIAELHAAVGALLKARLYVNEGGQFPCAENCATPCKVKHIVLKTDSAYLVQGITRYINKWRQNGWKTATNKEVKNRDLWEWLEALIDAYEDMEVGVDFCVTRACMAWV